ncbi:hypothetical protein ACFLYP_01290 [Chloroflexota bacterium]
MKQDRFLIGIVIGIVLLMLAAVGLFFMRQSAEGYVADDTPEGVIYNYVYAVQQEDYERAYSYLADRAGKPSMIEFNSNFLSYSYYDRNIGVTLQDTQIIVEDGRPYEAFVDLVVIHVNPGPFRESYHSPDTARLIYQEGQWKITLMPHPFWNWNWYEDGVDF